VPLLSGIYNGVPLFSSLHRGKACFPMSGFADQTPLGEMEEQGVEASLAGEEPAASPGPQALHTFVPRTDQRESPIAALVAYRPSSRSEDRSLRIAVARDWGISVHSSRTGGLLGTLQAMGVSQVAAYELPINFRPRLVSGGNTLQFFDGDSLAELHTRHRRIGGVTCLMVYHELRAGRPRVVAGNADGMLQVMARSASDFELSNTIFSS
jgi:hypothetical protein